MTKENNGWISVDERLPPISDDKWFYSSGSLLCYGKEEPTDNNHIFIGYSTDGNGFYSDNGSCYQVFFWQPLPQPPTITIPSQFESVGVNLIAQERLRQQSEKGFTLNSDTQYANDELVKAAMCYLKAQSQHAIMPGIWPWGKIHWKPKDRKRNLIKAGALIAAEIDRLHNTTP